MFKNLFGRKNNVTKEDQYRIRKVEASYFGKFIQKPFVQLIDVRSEEEYSHEHIENAHNFDYHKEGFVDLVTERFKKDHPLAVYARNARCALEAAALLVKKDFAVTILNGGFEHWLKTGGDTTRGLPSFRRLDVTEDFPYKTFQWTRGNGALIYAGNKDKKNAMRIGWGTLGTLWGKNVATIFVAESCYTHHLLEENDYFTIMKIDNTEIMDYMGSRSGHKEDKGEALGLHTLYTEHGAPYFEEADLVMEVQVYYLNKLNVNSFRSEVPQAYYKDREDQVHSVIVGEIIMSMMK